MGIISDIVFVIFAILQIILFFKIWGMTNDIREIKNKYLHPEDLDNNIIEESQLNYEGSIPDDKCLFKENDLVILISNGKQMRIKRITDDGLYSCYTNGGTLHAGNFHESELRLFTT